jgi:hypothetical protein
MVIVSRVLVRMITTSLKRMRRPVLNFIHARRKTRLDVNRSATGRV